ncbi:MAG TPA: hypothetical protein VGG75_33510 [Trebonia sp.]
MAASGLRGRGGAAFPLARKLAAVAAQSGEHVVLVNGEEGEPASVKDRWLLRTRPHLVLDGALVAARAVSARAVCVYVSDSAAAVSLDAAVAELGTRRGTGRGTGRDTGGGASGGLLGEMSVRVFQVGPSYVAGEETAAVNAVNGQPAKPSDKPPRRSRRASAGGRLWCPTLRRSRTCPRSRPRPPRDRHCQRVPSCSPSVAPWPGRACTRCRSG